MSTGRTWELKISFFDLLIEYVLSYWYQLTSLCFYIKFVPDFNKNIKLVGLTSDHHSPLETWRMPQGGIVFESVSVNSSPRLIFSSLSHFPQTIHLNSIIHLTCLAKKKKKCLEIVRNCHSGIWHEVMSTPSKQFSEHPLCQYNLF